MTATDPRSDAATHARALAALDGARSAHLWPDAVSDLLANALARHQGRCRWHILNEPACAAYGDALRALGIGGGS